MELPYDVLVHTFKYLSKFDRLSASETCRSWYEAANDHYFRKNKVVMFYNNILNDESLSPLQTFEDTSLTYFNYHFCSVYITDKFNSFWNKKGETIRTLTLERCSIGEQEFVYMLQKCKYLKSLNIVEGFAESYEGQELDGILDNSLAELKSISFIATSSLTDALLSRLFSAAPALEKLELSSCLFSFEPINVIKDYLSECSHAPSQKKLSFYFILQLIKSSAKNIKYLRFINQNIDSEALRSLLETENLKLETLKIYSLTRMLDMRPLTTHQVFLKELVIGASSSLTNGSLINICKNLVNLELLNIGGCYNVTDLGISELPKLKKLKSLSISYCMITQDAIIGGICAEVNVMLKDLDIAYLKFDEYAIVKISERLPNLRRLNLSKCQGVTDLTLPFIFKNLQFLQNLDISYSVKVTDAGLTGIKIVEPGVCYEHNDSIFRQHHLSPLPKRSKLHEEIVYVSDHKLGKIYCARGILDTGLSLSHLKHLQDLNISGCPRITDVSLAHAVIFEGLIRLNINFCEKITRMGFECLVQNCRTIEHISVLGCKVRDDDVKQTVKTLRRLKELKMSRDLLRARRSDNEITFVESMFLYRKISDY